MMEASMNQKAKKKRQQRAQSRLALARSRQQEREQRQKTAAQRAEKQWAKTQRRLTELGATVSEHQETVDGVEKKLYEVHFEEKVYRFGTRFRVQRWLKREQERKEEREMSWAERHVQWMIENNCDDHGNPWPSEEW
jgi:hypothetical protein